MKPLEQMEKEEAIKALAEDIKNITAIALEAISTIKNVDGKEAIFISRHIQTLIQAQEGANEIINKHSGKSKE